MKNRDCSKGFSLLELMLSAAVLVIVVIVIAVFFSKSTPFYQRTRVRHQVMTTSRMGIETIMDRLRNGKARSVAISTPNFTPAVPTSRVDFVLQTSLPSGATSYAIYLQNGTVYTQEFTPAPPAATPGPQTPRALMSNVTSLRFQYEDSRDPGMINVSLRMDVPWDASGDPTHVSTIILPNHTVHMVETP